MDTKENSVPGPTMANAVPREATAKAVKKKPLTAKWIFDAAMLSSPVDLSALVQLSLEKPAALAAEPGLLDRMVTNVLNNKNGGRLRVDKKARLDVVKILGHVAVISDDATKADVRSALEQVSAWFDEYMADEGEECDALATLHDLGAPVSPEPDLHKAMLVLLCRCYFYGLKTQDLMELCRGNRRLALETVAGLLEDGESLSTAVAQRHRPGEKQRGVWEKVLVACRWERALVAQACELLRGFTEPAAYFAALDDGFYFLECGMELPGQCVNEFSLEMHLLLTVALHEGLVEKLAYSLHEALFDDVDARILTPAEHAAVHAAHEFFQNVYFFGAQSFDGGVDAERYRRHLLCDTLLVPHLILPYLDRCIYHVGVLERRHASSKNALAILGHECADLIDDVTARELDDPDLTRGIAATLRTLVLATFRAPRTRVMFQILRRFNPTTALLADMPAFVARHENILLYLLMLNVNMGAFDISAAAMRDEVLAASASFENLKHVATIVARLPETRRRRLHRRLLRATQLPMTRDAPSYAAVVHLLSSGAHHPASFDESIVYAALALGDASSDNSFSETADFHEARRAMKFDAERRVDDHHRRLSEATSQDDSDDDSSEDSDAAPRDDDPSGVFTMTYNLEDAIAGEAYEAAGKKRKKKKKKQPETEEDRDNKFKVLSLLGNLPTLDSHKRAPPKKEDLDSFLKLDLQLPKPPLDFAQVATTKAPRDPKVPEAFVCAINGHLMRDPVRHATRLEAPRFERETIELWLDTRGSICPITGDPLAKDDLITDKQLQTDIARFQIEQKMLQNNNAKDDDDDDDLYNF